MNVQELMDALATADPSARVLIADGDCTLNNAHEQPELNNTMAVDDVWEEGGNLKYFVLIPSAE